MVGKRTLDYEVLSRNDIPNLHDTFVVLRAQASEAQLLELTNHTDPIVRGYAIWGLIDKGHMSIIEVFKSLASDTTMVKTRSRDLLDMEPLSFLLYQRVRMNMFYSKRRGIDSLQNRKILWKLDSLMLYNDGAPFKGMEAPYDTHPGFDRVIESAFWNNHKHLAAYDIIRVWAIDKKHPYAISALASFQNPADIEALKQFGPQAYEAIALFPHDDFRTYLAQVPLDNYNSGYFQALAAFKDQWAADQLTMAYTGLTEPNKGFLIYQLRQSMNVLIPEFQPLVIQIFKDTGRISKEWMELLMINEPQLAADLIASSFDNHSDIFVRPDELYEYFDNRQSIYFRVLDHLHQFYPEKLEQICALLLPEVGLPKFDIYTGLIERHQLTGLTAQILDLLNQDLHAFKLYHLAKAALSFKNEQTSKRVLELLRKHKERWNFGIYIKNMPKLLKEYGLALD